MVPRSSYQKWEFPSSQRITSKMSQGKVSILWLPYLPGWLEVKTHRVMLPLGFCLSSTSMELDKSPPYRVYLVCVTHCTLAMVFCALIIKVLNPRTLTIIAVSPYLNLVESTLIKHLLPYFFNHSTSIVKLYISCSQSFVFFSFCQLLLMFLFRFLPLIIRLRITCSRWTTVETSSLLCDIMNLM